MSAAPKFMPELRTAHDVRKLACCRTCGDLGSRTFMIELPGASGGYEHGSCYIERNGIGALVSLPAAKTNGLALGDIGPGAMRALLDARAAKVAP